MFCLRLAWFHGWSCSMKLKRCLKRLRKRKAKTFKLNTLVKLGNLRLPWGVLRPVSKTVPHRCKSLSRVMGLLQTAITRGFLLHRHELALVLTKYLPEE
jgi:hypothetical protein